MIALEAPENEPEVVTAKVDLRWGSGATTLDRLVADGSSFSFYQAVRVLLIQSSEEREPQSHDSIPVRFRSQMDFNFPGADIREIRLGEGKNALPEMLVDFLGLAGAHGPLPAVYTEQVLRHEHGALRDFLDIFNHRLILLVYRIHEMHHPELTAHAPDQGLAANHLYAILGWGRDPHSAIRNRLTVPDRVLLNYAGLLAQRPRSAIGLQILIADYFQVPVAVEEFVGAWFELSPDQWTRLGSSTSTGANQALGDGAILGKRVWDQNAGVTIQLGPLDLRTFRSFLPEGAAYKSLSDLARVYLGDEIDFSFRLELRDDQIPWAELSGAADSRPDVLPLTLGRVSWLRNSRAGEASAVHAAALQPAGNPLKHGGQ